LFRFFLFCWFVVIDAIVYPNMVSYFLEFNIL